jgi:hypothetical protein
MMYLKIVGFLVLQLESQILKKKWKNTKFLTFLDQN